MGKCLGAGEGTEGGEAIREVVQFPFFQIEQGNASVVSVFSVSKEKKFVLKTEFILMNIHEEVVLKEVTLSGLSELQSISQTTFLQAFGADNDPDDMKAYMEEAFSFRQIKKELENPESLFFFALYRNQVIGYLKVNWGAAQTEYQPDHAMELQRIYILEDFHGKKIGQLLMNKALEIAKEKQLRYIWLGVWEKNTKALGLYKKNGFQLVGTHQFLLGDDLQTDLVMNLDLKD
jgi:ribosomal protein S18 acetylase RimI-like enzyme